MLIHTAIKTKQTAKKYIEHYQEQARLNTAKAIENEEKLKAECIAPEHYEQVIENFVVYYRIEAQGYKDAIVALKKLFNIA